MAEFAIGIDLGTSNSCAASAHGGKLEVLTNAYGENTTASVVAFAEDGSVEVGNKAKANIIHDPSRTVYSAKRLIGRYFFSEEVKKAQAICAYDIVEGPNHAVRIQVGDEVLSLPEVSAMVLREMKQIAEAKLGVEVTKAVVTVPAYFNDNQRQATKDAGRIAGLEILRILNEPTAAALAYGFGRGLEQRVAVYDLGGGTFDISVLEIGKDIFEVLATCGDTFLGGDDFDDRLIDLLADEFVAREGINPRNDRYAYEKLKLAAENAKKGLSVEEEVVIRIPDVIEGADGVMRSLERTITRTEFGELVQDLVQRTFKVCDEALQQADLTPRDLDGVILVGGPTRLELVRDAVAQYFQQEAHADVDPDEVVAMGAAIHAESLISGSQDSFLLDVTPLDLRIGVAGGLAEPVIERNTPVPIEQTRHFTTFKDFQESVQIRVYQGDGSRADDNELLGQFEFSGFERAKRGDTAIDVTFEINTDGIVEVTACDPNTGEQASTRITLSSGLSEEELQEIVEEDRAARVQLSEPADGGAGPLGAGEPIDILDTDDDLGATPQLETGEEPAAVPPEIALGQEAPTMIGEADVELDLMPAAEFAETVLDGMTQQGAPLEELALTEADLEAPGAEFGAATEAPDEPAEESVEFAKIELQKVPAPVTVPAPSAEPELIELEVEAELEPEPDAEQLFDLEAGDLADPDELE